MEAFFICIYEYNHYICLCQNKPTHQLLISCNPYSIGFRVVPVVARYEESMFNTIRMKDSVPRTFSEADLTEIILQALYKIPDYLSVQKNILFPLNMKAEEGTIMMIRKRLVAQGLIVEKEPESPSSLIKITSEGYQAIRDFDTYKNYDKEQKRMALSQRRIQYLEERNLRLKNLNILIGIASFLIGSLSGVLLSDPIKSMLRQWLEDN